MNKTDLEMYLKAENSLFFVQTHEEDRFEEVVRNIARSRKMNYTSWSLAAVIEEIYNESDPSKPKVITSKQAANEFKDLLSFLEDITKAKKKTVFVLKDLGRMLEDIGAVRRIKEYVLHPYIYDEDCIYKPIFILDPALAIPPSIEKEGIQIDFDLMGKDEILSFLSPPESENTEDDLMYGVPKEDKIKIAETLRGLCQIQILYIYLRLASMIKECKDRKEDIKTLDIVTYVKKEKQKSIRTEFLEIIDCDTKAVDVGGLKILKDWLLKRGKAFSEEAAKYGLPKPKGVLLLGIPGTGKSLISKTIANMWKVPLIKLDVGKLFNSLVGASERNIRHVLKIIETMGSCVVWLDEIEKGMAGIHSSTYSDAGTTARVMGSMLTWMQEQQSGAFIVGTCNNISQLPPELLRKGRFSEIFFISLPSDSERKEIWNIHLNKKVLNYSKKIKSKDIEKLVGLSKKFTGAEIEECITSAMFDAFDDNSRILEMKDLEKELSKVVPLATTMESELKSLYSWAKAGKVRFASESETPLGEQKTIGFNVEDNKKLKEQSIKSGV